jgi:hypothetical protein
MAAEESIRQDFENWIPEYAKHYGISEPEARRALKETIKAINIRQSLHRAEINRDAVVDLDFNPAKPFEPTIKLLKNAYDIDVTEADFK